MLKRIQRLIEDPTRIKRALIRRMPGVITAGSRAVTRKVRRQGIELFLKEYSKDEEGIACLQRELLAREIFADMPWIIPVTEQGDTWISLPFLPENTRLDHAAIGMDKATRMEVAKSALSAMLDIHTAGYFHGDFQTHNLFWFQNQLMVGDFEKLSPYPDKQRPHFLESYDLTGKVEGVEVPGDPNAPAMYYSAVTPVTRSLELILDIPLSEALKEFDKVQ